MKNTQWDSFQLFVQVARFGGLTGASASSGLSPATIGRRMLDLEHEIGKALFIRSQKGYSLTADGQVLLDHLQDKKIQTFLLTVNFFCGGLGTRIAKASGHELGTIREHLSRRIRGISR